MRYVSADEISEAQEAYRNNVPLHRIASYMRVTVDELSRLLNLPADKAFKQNRRPTFGRLMRSIRCCNGSDYATHARRDRRSILSACDRAKPEPITKKPAKDAGSSFSIQHSDRYAKAGSDGAISVWKVISEKSRGLWTLNRRLTLAR